MTESSEASPLSAASSDKSPGHALRKELRLRDLVPMQVLLVVGIFPAGIAAHQGSTHVVSWLLGVTLLLMPVAAVVHYCVEIWPLEGGVYQWTRHTMGALVGFLAAWNLAAYFLLIISNLGILTAASLSYGLGPRAAWMADSRAFITGLNLGLFALIFLVNIPGFGIGRWVSHVGTALMLLVTALLLILTFVHPHATRAHPHLSPQPPFSLSFPLITLLSVNLISKIAFNGLTGLEQVAVFAGETRDAARTILRSAWIAAPGIALIYIVMTGALLTYTPADSIDLTGPIPQVLAAAFAGGDVSAGAIDWGGALSRIAILALAVAQVAQYAVIVAETSRLPMVAGWDHLIPVWFTRLHPRFRTPTRSLSVIVLLAVLFCCLASAGAGTQEAFQLIVTSANVCQGIYYLLMFAVPWVAGSRWCLQPGLKPSVLVRLASVCGIAVTLLATIFNFVPIVEVPNPWLFALKVGLATLGANLIGAAVYWRGSRAARRQGLPFSPAGV
jgi:amino acid transporter